MATCTLSVFATTDTAAFELSTDVTRPPGRPDGSAIALRREAGAGTASLSLFRDDPERTPRLYDSVTG